MEDQQAEQTLGRREFTMASILAMLSGVTITISGCGKSTPTQPAQPAQPAAQDNTGVVAANHGHVAIVTAAQQTTGAAVSLNIQGTASHSHTMELSVAELVSIRGGQRVAKDSTNNNGHMHTVTFN